MRRVWLGFVYGTAATTVLSGVVGVVLAIVLVGSWGVRLLIQGDIFWGLAYLAIAVPLALVVIGGLVTLTRKWRLPRTPAERVSDALSAWFGVLITSQFVWLSLAVVFCLVLLVYGIGIALRGG